MGEQQPLDWCKQSSISPGSWIPGFSDNTETFFCAIAGGQDGVGKRMEEKCCKGELKQSGDGCYHWCEPHAMETVGWSVCIADNVYTDTVEFGYSCNSIGALEEKNFVSNGLELRPGATPTSRGVALSASWKVGVLVGGVGLFRLMF